MAEQDAYRGSEGWDSIRELTEKWMLSLCPLRQCEHGPALHDGDGVSEDFMCCVDDCGCRGHYEWAT